MREGGRGGTQALLPGQRSNPSPRLAWRCDKAPLPLSLNTPSPVPPSHHHPSLCRPPLLPIMCHVLNARTPHAVVRRAFVFALGLSLSTQVKEMYRSKSGGDKETHEESKSFAGKC